MRKYNYYFLLFLLPLSLFGQGKFVSIALTPNISGIKVPKPYEFGKPLFSMNYGVNYSVALKKHYLFFGLEHITNRVAVTYSITTVESPEGGIGTVRNLFKTKGVVFDMGYGYEILSRKKLKMIPYARVGMGYFYAAGFARDFSEPQVNNGITTVARNTDNFGPSLIEKFFYKWEIGSKLVFSPSKKLSFIMTPYYSLANRLRDGTKEYAFRSWYTSVGVRFGVQLNI